MARTWWSITVELLGGRAEELWPPPGRIFAVRPTHTFVQFADSVNDAFARWDRSHLSLFTCADGRIVTDSETGAELASGIGGPLLSPLDIGTTRLADVLSPGEEFQFTFDLGDDWTHRCVITADRIDPREELGLTPRLPLPFWGWGQIPDQYGRRTADDDGQSPTPPRPSQPHPMLRGAWPAEHQLPELNLREVRGAIARADTTAFLAAISGREIDDALQQIAAGLPLALREHPSDAEPITLSVINRLSWRGSTGDDVLAADLLALLRHEEPTGRSVPVDLDMLSSELEQSPDSSTGCYLDLDSGEVVSESLTDAAMVGDDAAIDVDIEPDRWLRIDNPGSRSGWADMQAFAERQRTTDLRDRLQRAIEGTGAFGRFRDVVEEEALAEQWRAYSADRRIGRCRALLADHGIRVLPSAKSSHM